MICNRLTAYAGNFEGYVFHVYVLEKMSCNFVDGDRTQEFLWMVIFFKEIENRNNTFVVHRNEYISWVLSFIAGIESNFRNSCGSFWKRLQAFVVDIQGSSDLTLLWSFSINYIFLTLKTNFGLNKIWKKSYRYARILY